MIIGCGNTGSKIASMVDGKAILLSTAAQDTLNYKDFNMHSIAENGAGKKFSSGTKLWHTNIDKIKDLFKDIQNDKCVIVAALGGGSGSSSLSIITEILLKQNNKVLIIGIMPFIKENNPPLSNAVQAINSIVPYSNEASIMLFDNEKLIKKTNNDWHEINTHIVSRIDYIIHLVDRYSADMYSPITLDQAELDSVIFGGGFVDVSDSFIEEKNPVFEYGILDKTTKNFLIAMYVDIEIKDLRKIDTYHNILTGVVRKYANKVPNARMIPGIIRAKVNYSNSDDEAIKDRAYITIASGMNIEKYLVRIETMKNNAKEKAEIFLTKNDNVKILQKGDIKILDI